MARRCSGSSHALQPQRRLFYSRDFLHTIVEERCGFECWVR